MFRKWDVCDCECAICVSFSIVVCTISNAFARFILIMFRGFGCVLIGLVCVVLWHVMYVSG